MAAFRARRLVWSEISSMAETMPPICFDTVERESTLSCTVFKELMEFPTFWVPSLAARRALALALAAP